MRHIVASFAVIWLLAACGGEAPSQAPSPDSGSAPDTGTETSSAPEPASDTNDQSAEATAETSEAATDGVGDPASGEALFKQSMIAGAPGCSTCHSLQPGVRMVGPSMADAGTVAAAVEGMSAEAYLRESIVEPDAQVTEGFTPGLMFQDYGDRLSQEQINDLVAFLLTQK